MTRWVLYAFGFSLALAGIVEGVAQETKQVATATVRKAAVVPEGTYQPFDIWQKVRFGAAALVNPKAVEAATVVYAYDPDQVARRLSPGEVEKIRALFASGQLQFGKANAIGKAIVESKTSANVVTTILACGDNCPQTLRGKFLSVRESVAGVQPSGTWIAWQLISVKAQEKEDLALRRFKWVV